MKKQLKLILGLLISFVIGFTMAACQSKDEDEISYADVVSVRVDETVTAGDFGGYPLEGFDISKVKLIVKLKDTVDENGNTVPGEEKEIEANINMVKAEDKAKLSVAGTKDITLIYGKHEVTFLLKLYDSDTEKFRVSFYDNDGTTLLGEEQYIQKGDRATQPNLLTKAGYDFIGWKDSKSGEFVTLDNITKDMTLIATYLPSNKVIEYYSEYNGKTELIKSEEIGREDSGEKYYPAEPVIDGYEFVGWKKVNDTKYYAQYKKIQYRIKFVYRRFDGEGAEGKYTDSFVENIVYLNDDNNTINAPADAACDGISSSNDFQFAYWYTKHGDNKVKMDFPYVMENVYEMTVYAEYIDINVGSKELKYKSITDGECVISGYDGEEGIVVIPVYAPDGDKVVGINDGIFKESNIEKFVVSNENEYFYTGKDGVLYSIDKRILYAYPKNAETESYNVSEETEEINPYAFYNADKLKNVKLNDNLKTIGDYAFSECTALEEIIISANVERIEEGAFKMKGENAVSALKFNGTELVSVKDEAFYGLFKLKKLNLPASLESIGDGTFYGCSGLEEITAISSNYFRIDNGALYDYGFNSLYLYPSRYKNGINPEFIVHADCAKLERGAFYNAGLECITFRSDVELNNNSIECQNLRAVRIDALTFTQDINRFVMGFGNNIECLYVKNGNTNITEQSFVNTKFSDVEVIFYDEWTPYADYYSDYILEYTDDGIIIKGYRGNDSNLDIPYMIQNKQVIAIDDCAFIGNTFIEQVSIPVGVKVIEEKAFYGCKSLKKVTFPSTLEEIGDYAFYNCKSLSSVVTGPGHIIGSMGRYVFEGTAILESEEEFVIISGALIGYNGDGQSVTIPSEVNYIASDAFKGNGELLSIGFEINSQLKVVDEYAFFNCTGIRNITFPLSVKKIYNNAFYGCDYLFYVEFISESKSVTLGNDAFYMAGNHYGINSVNVKFADTETYTLIYHTGDKEAQQQNGIAFIDYYEPELTTDQLFIGWYKIEEIETENGTEEKKIYVEFPFSIKENTDLYLDVRDIDYFSDGIQYRRNDDGNYVIIGYSGEDEKVIIPATYQDAAVVGIESEAFTRRSKDITDVVIPNEYVNNRYISRILKVGADAFKNTSWYDNVSGDFVVYDNLLLGYKGNARKVVIPSGITIIAEGVFRDNVFIEEVIFPEGIGLLPKNTFSGCTALKRVVLSNDTTEIAEGAFTSCINLTEINFEELNILTIISPSAFENTAWSLAQKEDCVIVNGILYKYKGTVSELHIPGSVTSIADSAFEGNSSLKTLHFPSSLVTIRERAFADMISLNAVYLPSSGSQLTYILTSAFENCYNLAEFNFSNAANLADIEEKAFYNCASFKDLILPSNVIFIGEYSFGNSGLQTVTFEKDSRLSEIGDHAFSGCRSLYSVEFKGSSILTVIGRYAFENCIALRKFVNTSAAISDIWEGGFYNCRSLTEFNINENSISDIGKEAIYKLGYIAENNANMVIIGNILVSYKGTDKIVEIPEKITVIYDSAFEGNTNVTEIRFKSDNKLRKISDRAFYGCKNLISINFPTSVTQFGYSVMDGTQWYKDKLNTDEYITVNNSLIKYNTAEIRQAVIPNEVTTILRGAFEGTSVYDIKIHAGVTVIEDGAFDGIIPAIWEEDGISVAGWTLTMDSVVPPELNYEEPFSECVAVFVNNAEILSKFRLNRQWEIQYDSLKLIEKYTVNFNVVSNEGNPINPESAHALYNPIEVTPKITIDKQYMFVGWFYDAEYTKALSYPFILTKNTTIYAKCVDYDEGSNPKDYELVECGEEKPGSYSIVNYLDRTDKSVVIITEQSNKSIYSITGYIGYIEYSGEGEKYVFNQETNAFEEYDQYKIYPEGTVTYKKNTVIEELNFANNCTIEVLGDFCFAGLKNLKKITLPSSVRYISANAFADCENLKEIVFSSEMKDVVIEENAFLNCSSLETVRIPSSVIKLENNAFAGCEKLKTVYLEASTPIVLDAFQLPFDYTVPDFKIVIPEGSYTKYSSAWQEYERFLVEADELE